MCVCVWIGVWGGGEFGLCVSGITLGYIICKIIMYVYCYNHCQKCVQ